MRCGEKVELRRARARSEGTMSVYSQSAMPCLHSRCPFVGRKLTSLRANVSLLNYSSTRTTNAMLCQWWSASCNAGATPETRGHVIGRRRITMHLPTIHIARSFALYIRRRTDDEVNYSRLHDTVASHYIKCAATAILRELYCENTGWCDSSVCKTFSSNALKCSGVRQLHFEVFSAIQV